VSAPIRPPDHTLTNRQGFISWLAYIAPWEPSVMLPAELRGWLAVCPMCLTVVLIGDATAKYAHAMWHADLAFGTAPTGIDAGPQWPVAP